jgi:hypothetical protein
VATVRPCIPARRLLYYGFTYTLAHPEEFLNQCGSIEEGGARTAGCWISTILLAKGLKGARSRPPTARPTGPVRDLEVGRYGELARRSVRDGLSPDHIPSNAARRASMERQLGRELTPTEARALRDKGNCLVVQTCAHQRVSRTYGGRNSPSQIAADAADLRRAANQDLAVWRRYLIGERYSPAEVDAAIERLHAANVADGVYGN